MTSCLYVADLDGTLLRPDGTLGERTRETVNALVAGGGLFTLATARSFHAARRLTAGLDLRLPVIVYGGAMVVDPVDGARLRVAYFDKIALRSHVEWWERTGLQPVVYLVRDGVDRYCWREAGASPAVRDFVGPPPYGPRALPVRDLDAVDLSQVFYVALPGADDTPVGVEGRPGPGSDVVAGGVGKGREVSWLRARLGARRVVVFGDGYNDLSMFDVADESYAVAEAPPEVRERATAVIGRSADEAVAAWLRRSQPLPWDMP